MVDQLGMLDQAGKLLAPLVDEGGADCSQIGGPMVGGGCLLRHCV